MEIYFVRHGQTGGNVAKRHQAEHTGLTPLGKQQAKEAAEIIKGYEPTHIITSTLVRSLQTANEIATVCDMIPSISTEFVELERPKQLHGHFHRSFGSLVFYFRWYFGLTSDEQGESYRELRARINRAKALLALYPEDARVVVVSHSVFMGMFLAHICRDEMITPLQAFRSFRTILKMQNTHILPVLFDARAPEGVCAWQQNL